MNSRLHLETYKTRPTPKRPPGLGQGGCEFVFGLGWTGFSLLFVIIPIAVLVTEWQTSTLLQATGVTTEAVVIDRRIVEDSDGDTYYVTYRYWAPLEGDQTRLIHEESVSHDTYEDLPLESRGLVRYSATYPNVVRLEGQSQVAAPLLLVCFTLFGALFVLIGAWLVYSSGRQIYQARLLAWHAKIATGRVTDCWIETDSDGDKEYCVAFCFAEPGRPEVTAAEVNRKAYNTLQVGDSVQVRYVPGKPDICFLKM